MVGMADSVLIRKVSLIWSVLVERFHCMYIYTLVCISKSRRLNAVCERICDYRRCTVMKPMAIFPHCIAFWSFIVEIPTVILNWSAVCTFVTALFTQIDTSGRRSLSVAHKLAVPGTHTVSE